MQLIFLILSTSFAMISQIIGISTTLFGNFRPQRMTRFLIFFIALLYVGTLYAQGDKNGIYIAIAQLIGSFLLFIISIKKGMGGYEKSDILVLCLALLSLLIWQVTSNPLLGLFMSIIADIISFTPSFVKTWRFPETEEWRFYMSDVVASTFSILSIGVYSVENLTFPVYLLFLNATSVVMILYRRRVLRTPSDELKS